MTRFIELLFQLLWQDHASRRKMWLLAFCIGTATGILFNAAVGEEGALIASVLAVLVTEMLWVLNYVKAHSKP